MLAAEELATPQCKDMASKCWSCPNCSPVKEPRTVYCSQGKCSRSIYSPYGLQDYHDHRHEAHAMEDAFASAFTRVVCADEDPLSVENGRKFNGIDHGSPSTPSLFIDAFLQNNRVEHMVQVMGYHPQYLAKFLDLQHYLLRDNGPLPYTYRHYIAIMAAARHKCAYIINTQTQEFRQMKGDEKWLESLSFAPKKLQALDSINRILAHQPWLISKEDIAKLSQGEANWSKSELMQAIVLLAHFHCLSSFVYGCGINPEIDHPRGHSYIQEVGASPPPQAGSVDSGAGVDGREGVIESLIDRMRDLSEQGCSETVSQEEMQERFDNVDLLTVQLPEQEEIQSVEARYVLDPDFTYLDFRKHRVSCAASALRVTDYSWDDHGYYLVNRLYNEVGLLLDEKFKQTYNLTYHTMGDQDNVDTTAFRRAVWNYIHRLYGFRHDDYNYSEIHKLLEQPLLGFVKTVACYPERVTRKEYDNFMPEFTHSEKVHINLMVMEARLQAELLFALRAITAHMR